ncbi:phage integrase SAM-like domain-containing protein [uncultured Dokdonia sp.]|uniref:phage integrase SAM-like domain-containing protein n=1 Tax=uncultured Dokdonia sp. TaxID=575653 RepID=UPI00260B358B|nr:phage integrase SAM-like domain-containing protein [uncultured Dokdonia sp.]
MKNKKLPIKSKKHKGLMIYCPNNDCKKYFTWTEQVIEVDGKKKYKQATCGISGYSYTTCKSKEKHVFKSRVHISGTTRGTISRTLKAETYTDAVVEAIAFEKEVKDKILDVNVSLTPKKQPRNQVYLASAQSAYILFLENIDVADHLKKERTQKHIKEVFKSLTQFNDALKKKGIKKTLIRMLQINDDHVGYFHSYLLNEKKYANKTYNNKIGVLRSFFAWAITEFELNMANPFSKARNRTVNKQNDSITIGEYKALLKVITPENGISYEGKDKKTKRNRYKPWLKSAIELGLQTGGRREEIIILTWDMVKYVENEPSYLEVPNLKVERGKGIGFNDDVPPKIIPITVDLLDLLNRLGFEEKKNTKEYLLNMNRETSPNVLIEQMSKGFSHFYKLLETGKSIQFKHLRKTYISYMKLAMGSETGDLTSHSSNEVIDKNYVDKRVIANAQRKFKLFN